MCIVVWKHTRLQLGASVSLRPRLHARLHQQLVLFELGGHLSVILRPAFCTIKCDQVVASLAFKLQGWWMLQLCFYHVLFLLLPRRTIQISFTSRSGQIRAHSYGALGCSWRQLAHNQHHHQTHL